MLLVALYVSCAVILTSAVMVFYFEQGKLAQNSLSFGRSVVAAIHGWAKDGRPSASEPVLFACGDGVRFGPGTTQVLLGWYFQDQIESYSHKLTGWTWKHWLERSMAHPCRNHAAER